MNNVVCLFAKNGLGNIIFEIEAAARYAKAFHKSLYINLNETNHYGERERDASKYFDIKHVEIQKEIDPHQFLNPYPARPQYFDRRFIDEELIETKPRASQLGRLNVLQKYDRWRFHWRTRSNRYACRNAEHLGLIGNQHDAVLFLTTYIRNESERFLHFDFSAGVKTEVSEYIASIGMKAQPDFGIHIRYTDNLNHAGGRLTHGLEKALACTRDFLEGWYDSENSKPTIHVASDNASVIDLFTQNFASSSNIQSLPIERTDKAMHIGQSESNTDEDSYFFAIADILLLSQSSVFAFMGNSSFSRVARNMQPLHLKSFDWNN